MNIELCLYIAGRYLLVQIAAPGFSCNKWIVVAAKGILGQNWSNSSISNNGYWAMSLCYWQVLISTNCCVKFQLHQITDCPNIAYVKSRPLVLRDDVIIYRFSVNIYICNGNIYGRKQVLIYLHMGLLG